MSFRIIRFFDYAFAGHLSCGSSWELRIAHSRRVSSSTRMVLLTAPVHSCKAETMKKSFFLTRWTTMGNWYITTSSNVWFVVPESNRGFGVFRGSIFQSLIHRLVDVTWVGRPRVLTFWVFLWQWGNSRPRGFQQKCSWFSVVMVQKAPVASTDQPPRATDQHRDPTEKTTVPRFTGNWRSTMSLFGLGLVGVFCHLLSISLFFFRSGQKSWKTGVALFEK